MREAVRYLLTTTPLGRWARPFLLRAYERRFWPRGMNLMSGAFPSYDAALRHAPPGRPTGWDEQGIAENLVGETVPERQPVERASLPVLVQQTSAFAVLLWLRKLIGPGARIVDVGGASGITYWQYRDYFELPPGANWTVVDVPQVIARGRALAAARGEKNISFSEDLAALDECEVLMSLGCIQYMAPEDYATFMQAAGRARWVIINKLPLIEGPEFWTLQCLKTTFSPYRVPNRAAFLGEFEALGFEVCDAWDVPELSIDIPFLPERHVPTLNGLVLRRRSEVKPGSELQGREALVAGP